MGAGAGTALGVELDAGDGACLDRRDERPERLGELKTELKGAGWPIRT